MVCACVRHKLTILGEDICAEALLVYYQWEQYMKATNNIDSIFYLNHGKYLISFKLAAFIWVSNE